MLYMYIIFLADSTLDFILHVGSPAKVQRNKILNINQTITVQPKDNFLVTVNKLISVYYNPYFVYSYSYTRFFILFTKKNNTSKNVLKKSMEIDCKSYDCSDNLDFYDYLRKMYSYVNVFSSENEMFIYLKFLHFNIPGYFIILFFIILT